MAGAFHILAFPGEWNAMIYFFCKLTLRYGQDNIKMRHTRITNLIGLEQEHVVTNHLRYYEACLPHKPLYLHYSFVCSLCSPYTPLFMGQYRSWSFDSELAPFTRSYRNIQSCVMTSNLWLLFMSSIATGHDSCWPLRIKMNLIWQAHMSNGWWSSRYHWPWMKVVIQTEQSRIRKYLYKDLA